MRKDSLHQSDPLTKDVDFYSPQEMEDLVVDYLRSLGIRLSTEEELKKDQKEKYGRPRLTPDILFLDPVFINGSAVRWMDVKNIYGSYLVNTHFMKNQVTSYVQEWGPGAVVFGMGYSDMLTIPGAIVLDTTPIPRKGRHHITMKGLSHLYSSVLNRCNWTPTLSTELSGYIRDDLPLTNSTLPSPQVE